MNALTFAIFKIATTLVCAFIAAVQYYGFKLCDDAKKRKGRLMPRLKEQQRKRQQQMQKNAAGGAPQGLYENLMPQAP
jgi:hypothetical protein